VPVNQALSCGPLAVGPHHHPTSHQCQISYRRVLQVVFRGEAHGLYVARREALFVSVCNTRLYVKGDSSEFHSSAKEEKCRYKSAPPFAVKGVAFLKNHLQNQVNDNS
jgi:hypothetical protein